MATIQYDMDLDVKDALKSLNKYNKALKGTDKAMKKVDKESKKLSKSFGALKAGIAGVVGSLGLGALVKAGIESADSLGKVANKVGLTVEALQEFRYEADLAGVSGNTFDTAIQRFGRRVGEAAKGTGVLKDTLKELGISIRNQDGSLRSVNDLYLEYGDAIRNADSAQEKLRLSIKGFDTAGAGMINIFSDTAEAAAKLRKEAPKLTKAHTVSAAKAVDAWTKLQKTFAHVVQLVSIQLTPAIIKITEMLAKFAANENAINAMVQGFKELGNILILVAQAFGLLLANLKPVLAAFVVLKVAMAGGVFKNLLDSLKGITRGFSLAKKGSVKLALGMKALGRVLLQSVLMLTRLSVVGLGVWAVYEAFQALFGIVSDTDKAMDKLNDSTAEFTGKDVDVFQKKLVELNKEIAKVESAPTPASPRLERANESRLYRLKKEQKELEDAIKKGNERIAKEEKKAAEERKQFQIPSSTSSPAYNDTSAADAAKANRQLGLSFLPLKRAQEEYSANLVALNAIQITSTFTEEDKTNAIRAAAKAYSDTVKDIKGVTLATEGYADAQKELNDELKSTAEAYTPIIQQQKKFKETEDKLNKALKKGLLTTKSHAIAMKNLKKEIADFNKAQLANSRKWSDGWKRAMDAYVEDATNAAQQAEKVFQTATQGMEDAIVGFAKTGKFEWKSFLDDIVTQMLRSQIKQTMASLFQMPGLTGSAPAQTSGGGIGGASSGGGLGGLVGGVVSGIGKFFGGLFAEGGSLPRGQFGIVGEKGPELITGPANITPLTGGGSTAVNYYIQANDAQSFKQMIARDPKFLFAVTEEGRRNLPQYR